MRSCLILTAYIEQFERIPLDPAGYDFILCADGGLDYAHKLGLMPNQLIGDYDSTEKPDPATEPAAKHMIILPHVKDMADTEAALDLVYEKGFRDVTVLGGLGGRFDHTMGNVGMLLKYRGKFDHMVFEDGCNRVWLAHPGAQTISRDRFTYFSLIPYGGPVTGVHLTGTFYPLENAVLYPDSTLSVSNEILEDTATLSFEDGILILAQSSDTRL